VEDVKDIVETAEQGYAPPTEIVKLFEEAPGRPKLPKSYYKLLLKICTFVLIFNGALFQPMFQHYCWGRDCCATPQVTEDRMVAALTMFPLAALPDVPDSRSWTKLGPCIDRVMGYILLHSFIVRLMEIAYAPLNFPANPHAGDAGDGDIDPELEQHDSFHKVAGKRFHANMNFFRTQAHMCVLIAFAIVLEAVRYITQWLLRLSAEVQPPCHWPGLCNAVNASMSPIIHALQYLASLTLGTAPRLQLLYRYMGCQSYAVWCDQHKPMVRQLRRYILVAAVWINRRHWEELNTFPWLFACVPDTRIPYEQRVSLLERPLTFPSF